MCIWSPFRDFFVDVIRVCKASDKKNIRLVCKEWKYFVTLDVEFTTQHAMAKKMLFDSLLSQKDVDYLAMLVVEQEDLLLLQAIIRRFSLFRYVQKSLLRSLVRRKSLEWRQCVYFTSDVVCKWVAKESAKVGWCEGMASVLPFGYKFQKKDVLRTLKHGHVDCALWILSSASFIDGLMEADLLIISAGLKEVKQVQNPLHMGSYNFIFFRHILKVAARCGKWENFLFYAEMVHAELSFYCINLMARYAPWSVLFNYLLAQPYECDKVMKTVFDAGTLKTIQNTYNYLTEKYGYRLDVQNLDPWLISIAKCKKWDLYNWLLKTAQIDESKVDLYRLTCLIAIHNEPLMLSECLEKIRVRDGYIDNSRLTSLIPHLVNYRAGDSARLLIEKKVLHPSQWIDISNHPREDFFCYYIHLCKMKK